jgi:lipopolysaccharide transport system permease protein
VLYTIDIIPAQWRLLYGLNPMVGMIAGFRNAILGGPLPGDLIVEAFAGAVVLLVLALRYFTVVERRFADVI